MRRLSESDGPVSPIEAEAIELLRAAVDHQAPPGQKQRVRARLLQHRVSRRSAVLRPAVIVTAILLFGAAASAAVGRHWIAQTVQTIVGARTHRTFDQAGVSMHAARTRGRGRNHSPTIGGGLASGASAPAADLVAPAMENSDEANAPWATNIASDPVNEERARTARPNKGPRANATRPRETRMSDRRMGEARRHQMAGHAGETASAPSTTAPVGRTAGAHPGEDTGLVFDAMRLLRQEHRPGRASDLLDEYLRRHPTGALAEEALALSVEAAMARHDPRARELIERYLSRFPAGHFRAAVELSRARLSP